MTVFYFQPHGLVDGCGVCSEFDIDILVQLCTELDFSTSVKDNILFLDFLIYRRLIQTHPLKEKKVKSLQP